MPIKFLLLGVGVVVFLEGGGVEVAILFLWARGFFSDFVRMWIKNLLRWCTRGSLRILSGYSDSRST